ncbi:pyridoxal phosphate-dependent aminotransferase [Myxococcota bacterium]|nr:pyridoxal phosphate-dependent aminotransferase [Myxococcota bacterium]
MSRDTNGGTTRRDRDAGKPTAARAASLSRRTAWDLTPSRLAMRLAERRRGPRPLLDLADSNPTRVALREPAAALSAALAAVADDTESLRYLPEPCGPTPARVAIAAMLREDGATVAPEHVVLTSGTSEGYAHLFRLLADPGDLVHVPAPGYPLFEHLAALEGAETARYPLREPRTGARWRVDLDALAASLEPHSRVLLVIHPHHPSGSFLDPEDLAALRALACERGLAIVSDEVFAGSAFGAEASPGVLVGADAGPLHFVLGGLSKRLALPQLKISWIAVGGPAAQRDDALARLEFIADAYLSVSPLLAAAVPELLARRAAIAGALRARITGNRTRLAAVLAGGPHELLPAEAGWAAILRVPGVRDEDALVMSLLERGVWVHPGSLFDLESRTADGTPCAHLVLQLLAEPSVFDRALEILSPALARCYGFLP